MSKTIELVLKNNYIQLWTTNRQLVQLGLFGEDQSPRTSGEIETRAINED